MNAERPGGLGNDKGDPREPGLLALNRMKSKTSEFSRSAQADLNGFQNIITGETGFQSVGASESPNVPELMKDLAEAERLVSEIRERLIELDGLFKTGSLK